MIMFQKMEGKMSQKVFWFKKEKVTVVLWSNTMGVRKWRRLPPLQELRGGKMPNRLVIGLEFYDLGNQMKEGISLHSESGAEIRVRWNPKDVDHADGDYKNLQLYYYYDKAWHPFGQKHYFKLQPDPGNDHFGWGIATIQNWEDPPIAWDA
jgi:hypothetical protein